MMKDTEPDQYQDMPEFFGTMKTKIDEIGRARAKAINGRESRRPGPLKTYFMVMEYLMEEFCKDIFEAWEKANSKYNFIDGSFITLKESVYMELFKIIESVGYRLDLFQFVKEKDLGSHDYLHIEYFDFFWRLFGEGKENFMEGARGSGKSNVLSFFIDLLLKTGRFKVITNVNADFNHHPNFYFRILYLLTKNTL